MGTSLLGTTPDQTQSKYALELYKYSQVHMGVRVDVSCYAPDRETAERASSSAYKRFADLEAIMSDYRPDSEVMKLCDRAGQGPIQISADLYRVLSRAQEVARLSAGAFDVTCGPVVKLWREARKTLKGPSPFKLQEARSLVDYQFIVLDPDNRTAEIKPKGVRIDLGGIAKGDGCDQALLEMKKNGVTRALIEAGGDIAAGDPPPGRLGWPISIRGLKLAEPIMLANQGLSTSGDVEQFVELSGVRYSHIVDPRTGLGLTTRLQVSILAPDALTSDSLATAICVLGEIDGPPLLEKYGARAWYIRAK